MLEDTQNIFYFSDFNDEQQFIFSIQCLWAVMAGKSDVSILAVTLNADLAKYMEKKDVLNPKYHSFL